MKKFFFVLAVLVGGWPQPSITQAAGPVEIKFANLAPEGSAWANVMTEMDKEVQAASGGRLKFKFYWGGVMGDEPDMIRKLRINQIQAGGFTGLGLGTIVPAIRLLELPAAFTDTTALDQAKEKFLPQFKEEFQKKGFVFLGYADVGPINIFANKPIRSMADMKGAKFWMWEGDPLAQSAFKALQVAPIPLPVPDVLTSLQTNMIDAVYGPPLGVTALQWHTRVKYVMDFRFNYAMGGFIIDKKFYDSLPPDLKKILTETSQKYCLKLVERTRSDNDKALAALKAAGIQVVTVAEKDKTEMEALFKKMWQELVGKLYSQEQLEELKKIVVAGKGV
ncbi:MAG: TRAP transporter substrate-binding protein DctP [Deltaproteobacteria bacterium]|nr:TRAP transporter substrate-binding protein DctP [Deltaproteobacteria bacterium]